MVEISRLISSLIGHGIGDLSNFFHIKVAIIEIIVVFLDTGAPTPPAKLKIGVIIFIGFPISLRSPITAINVLIAPAVLLVNVLNDGLLFIGASL